MRTINPERVRRVLNRAVELIEEHGWIQMSYGSKSEGFCAAGAIDEASHEMGLDYTDVRDEARRAVADEIGRGLVTWNDEPGRRTNEVLTVMRDATEHLQPYTMEVLT